MYTTVHNNIVIHIASGWKQILQFRAVKTIASHFACRCSIQKWSYLQNWAKSKFGIILQYCTKHHKRIKLMNTEMHAIACSWKMKLNSFLITSCPPPPLLPIFHWLLLLGRLSATLFFYNEFRHRYSVCFFLKQNFSFLDALSYFFGSVDENNSFQHFGPYLIFVLCYFFPSTRSTLLFLTFLEKC